MSKEPNVLWQPNSNVQRSFLACSARTAMIGGGAGSGKTSALLAAAALQSGNPKATAVLFRRDYPSLRQIISASYRLFLPMRAAYNKSEHVWQFPSGSTLTFSHLEDDSAVFQHSGQEYSFIGYDEIQQLPGDDTDSRGQRINSGFAFMHSRLRAPAGTNLRLEVRCTGTPHGVGAQWVRSYFRIPDSGDSTEFVDDVTGFRRAYFKSTIEDNPALNRTDYHRQLLDLPEQQRRALLLGDWTAHIGQVFSEWDYQKHTCQLFNLPESWDAWLGADDGYAAPACVLLFAHDRTRDRIFIMDEIYQRGLTPEELARETLAMCERHGRGSLDGVIDSSAFAEIGLGNESGKGSRGHLLNQHGCRFQPSVKGTGSRVQGVDAVHRWLKIRDDGFGGLVVCRNCRNLIRTLPAMVYSKQNPEDIDPACEEHGVRALAYGLTRTKTFFARVKVKGI